MAALTLLFSPPHLPDFCFLIFSINPTGLGGLLPPNPHPSISPHRRVLGAGGHKGQPGTHLPHHASVCLVFYSPPPPTLYPPPVCPSPPPGATRPRSNGDPPSRHPPLTVPGTPGQGGRRDSRGGWGAPGLGEHQEVAGSHNLPSALCILAGIGTLWGWHGMTLFPPHDHPQPLCLAEGFI